MSEIALVHVTFADAAEAERIGAQMIADRLAACVTIHAPCRSIFRWEGEIDRAHEVPATFKTAGIRVERLRAAIVRLHSYDLPVVEVTTATVDAVVAAWIADSTM